jgi:hypothetical protein
MSLSQRPNDQQITHRTTRRPSAKVGHASTPQATRRLTWSLTRFALRPDSTSLPTFKIDPRQACLGRRGGLPHARTLRLGQRASTTHGPPCETEAAVRAPERLLNRWSDWPPATAATGSKRESPSTSSMRLPWDDQQPSERRVVGLLVGPGDAAVMDDCAACGDKEHSAPAQFRDRCSPTIATAAQR